MGIRGIESNITPFAGSGGPVNEVQRITFSAVPAYGRFDFAVESGDVQGSHTCIVEDDDEQAEIDAGWEDEAPTVTIGDGGLTRRYEFDGHNGEGELTDVAEGAFTPNTTTFPLNDGSADPAGFINNIDAVEEPEGAHEAYFLTWPEGAVGWVVISGNVVSRGALPATIDADGVTWTVTDDSGINVYFEAPDFDPHSLTLDGTFMGAAVTGVVSTVRQGG